MNSPARPTRYQHISPEGAQMLQIGESGRYEFKRDAEAVTPRLLAALANWAALDPDRQIAHLLVGVDEIEDPASGLVSGKPFGLAKGLDRTVARIQDVATRTRPIPVDVFIVEEAVAEKTPFIRVEVRPTMAPHFDDEGRRQTRQGRSTRALTDDELLGIYLDREAGSFAARFRQTSDELRSAVGAIGSQVDEIADAIDRSIAQPIAELTDTAGYAANAASAAESAADMVGYEVETVQRMMRELHDVVEEIKDNSPGELAARVTRMRLVIWWHFSIDTWKRTSTRANRLAKLMNNLLSREIPIDDIHNAWELDVWSELLRDREAQRNGVGTLKWWEGGIARVQGYFESPAYQAPELPDLRRELHLDRDAALDDPQSMTRKIASIIESD